MNNKFNFLYLLLVLLTLGACGDDDDDATASPPRDRGEQQILDNDSLVGYLETHYYNSSFFNGNTNPSMDDIIISELPTDENGNYLALPDPENNTLLIDAVETRSTVYEETDYTYYILRINQGGGDETPNFPDNIRINYKGNTQDEEVFDSTVNPVLLDLSTLVPGWRRVLPEFNTAEMFILNQDGTVDFTNAGVGVMFLPSGLGYFSGGAIGINPYSNLIFRFEFYQTEVNDHDFDNIPSYLEDLNDDLDLLNDNTDEDVFPNYEDIDDDGDGVLTRLEDLEPDTDLNDDADGDGDPTNDIGDGDPTNDDSDGDGVPNYLDEDDDCSNAVDEDQNGIPDCDE
ncbi:MAG: hypothetical protein HKO92_09105 [Flavobacteriaceae bacterium]|nr:hypothetical protein [Flavobacteriaceae bacterium]